MRVRILGIVILVLGFIMLFFARYIAGQIAEGRAQIESGQSQIKTYKKIFSIHPYSKEVGKQILKPYEERIAQGKTEISEYESLVQKLRISGVVLIVIGLAVVIIWGGGLWRRKSGR